MQIQRFGHPSYTDRMARSEIMRQQSGQYGDIRDLPDYTTAGRTQKAEYYWNQMGLPGTYQNTVAMSNLQEKANKWQAAGEVVSGVAQ